MYIGKGHIRGHHITGLAAKECQRVELCCWSSYSGDGKNRSATFKHPTCEAHDCHHPGPTSRSRSHGRKRGHACYHCDGIERGHGRHHPHSTLHLCSKRTVTTIHSQRCSDGESSHAGNSFATVVSHIPLVHLYTCITVAAYLYPCIPVYLYTCISVLLLLLLLLLLAIPVLVYMYTYTPVYLYSCTCIRTYTCTAVHVSVRVPIHV